MAQKLFFNTARFLKTGTQPSHYPVLRTSSGVTLPEVAIVGRSNVGKSSLLNHLLRQHGLARTSSTPGKTQALNFYLVDEQLVLVDLPGYGFANVPAQVRKNWGPMIQHYLEKRDSLKLILFLVDIRRIPSEDDLTFVKWADHYGKRILVVLTKCDKVKSNERRANARKIVEALGKPNLHPVPYSTLEGEARKTLLTLIRKALHDEQFTVDYGMEG